MDHILLYFILYSYSLFVFGIETLHATCFIFLNSLYLIIILDVSHYNRQKEQVNFFFHLSISQSANYVVSWSIAVNGKEY